MVQLIIDLFNLILYQPLFNFLVLLYQYLPGRDFGLSVIVLTIIIRLLLYPTTLQALRSQKALQEIQPEIKEIQKKSKGDKEKELKAILELYRKKNINFFSGIFPILIQLPILIALYRVFWQGLRPEEMVYLYSFVPQPGVIDPTFFGIIDLSKSFIVKVNNHSEYYWPVFILAILTGIFQFWQSKMITPKTKSIKKEAPDFSQIIQKQMLYFFPIFTIVIVCSLPSAIGLYWIVTTIFSIFQQHFVFRKITKL